eukprot:gene24382-27167_t
MKDPNRIHVFMYKGATGISSGSTSIPQAYGLLGIPYTTLATSPEDPILQSVKFRVPKSVRDPNSAINVAEIEGKVRALMVWDEQMLNFTIAHELAHIHNNDTIWHGFKDPAFIVGGFYAYNASVRSMAWVVPKAAFAKVKFLPEDKKSPGFLHYVYAYSTHPPSDWRTEALQNTLAGYRKAIYSVLTFSA